MKLQGKKIAFLGDSITEGVGTSSIDHVYWNVIAQRTGAECYGYGISGTRIAQQQRVPSPNPSHDQYFGSRVEKMIPDADIVVVFGGTNDFGHGDAALGHMDDRRLDTFYGAYHLLMQQLIERYPAAQIVVMTPLHRCSEDEDVYNELGVRRQGTLRRYAQAVREVAEFYGIPVCDLYATCKIQPRVEILKQMYMPDGLHPSDAGNVLVAERLLSVLNAL